MFHGPILKQKSLRILVLHTELKIITKYLKNKIENKSLKKLNREEKKHILNFY